MLLPEPQERPLDLPREDVLAVPEVAVEVRLQRCPLVLPQLSVLLPEVPELPEAEEVEPLVALRCRKEQVLEHLFQL